MSLREQVEQSIREARAVLATREDCGFAWCPECAYWRDVGAAIERYYKRLDGAWRRDVRELFRP